MSAGTDPRRAAHDASIARRRQWERNAASSPTDGSRLQKLEGLAVEILREIDAIKARLASESHRIDSLHISRARAEDKARREDVDRPFSVPMPSIVDAVCEVYGCDRDELMSRRFKQRYARQRRACVHLAFQLTRLTVTDIGRALGGLHITTVAEHQKRAAAAMEADPGFAQEIDAIARLINANCIATEGAA